MTKMLEMATSGIAGALGTSPLGAGMAIGGAILGAIGMAKKRKAEKRRKRKERAHALKAQAALVGSVGDIREEYRERAGFGKQAYTMQKEAGLLNYQQSRGEADAGIGSTGLAYSGTGEKQSSMLDRSFMQQNEQRQLGYQEDVFGLEKSLEGELRGVQMGLLNLEATAAERGYRLQGKGKLGPQVNTAANLGGI